MKQCIVFLLAASAAIAGHAQTSKPVSAKAGAKPATITRSAANADAVKLPPGVPPVHAPVKTAIALRFQDIVVGEGKDAEPNKMYRLHYTGWLAADGEKFDSSYDHTTPVQGKDGKQELDADGKPKVNPAQPVSFMQGSGHVIPGVDAGLVGMKVGGKRRLFIPWQLAYGARGRPGAGPNSGIPPMADLIFDVELVDVIDLPTRPAPHPLAPGNPGASPTNPSASTPPAPADQTNPASRPTSPASPSSQTTPAPAGTSTPANTPTTPAQSTPEKPQAH